MARFNRERAKAELGWDDSQINAYLRSNQARQDSAAAAPVAAPQAGGGDPLGMVAGVGSAAVDAIGGVKGLAALGGAGALYGARKHLGRMFSGGQPAPPVAQSAPARLSASAAAPKLSPSLHVLTEDDISRVPAFKDASPGEVVRRVRYEKERYPEAVPVRKAVGASDPIPVREKPDLKIVPRKTAPASKAAQTATTAPADVVGTPESRISAAPSASGKPTLREARAAVKAASFPNETPELKAAAKKAVIDAAGPKAWKHSLRASRRAAVGAAKRFGGDKQAIAAASRAAWYTSLRRFRVAPPVINLALTLMDAQSIPEQMDDAERQVRRALNPELYESLGGDEYFDRQTY